jgi:hypothetical protein
MLAIDKSNQHSGRIYVVYTNRPGIYSDRTRPYLIWSDDRGPTWSNPINVSTDQSTSTVIAHYNRGRSCDRSRCAGLG